MNSEEIDTVLDGLSALKRIRNQHKSEIIKLDKIIARMEKIEEIK